MSDVTAHPDEFTLLRFVAGETDQLERARVKRHLRSCAECETSLEATKHLDDAFREHGRAIMEEEGLGTADPFRARPVPARRRFRESGIGGAALAASYRLASAEAERLKAALLAHLAADSAPEVGALPLDRLAGRVALGGTLDESTQLLSEAPGRWRRLASDAVEVLATLGERADSLEALVYPIGDLRGRAHTVMGWALNWAGELDAAGDHLARAYGAFGQGSGSAADFAAVELHESQRRTFLERPREGLVLASRAATTFVVLSLDALAAKARFAEGLALGYLGRSEESLPLFESALEPLASAGLWNAYASVLNNLASTYVDLERYDRARRTYAQALRRVTREGNPGVHAFVRLNLGVIQLRTGRHREAAHAFAEAASVFLAQESLADQLVATLYRVEALAHFDLGAARRLLRELEERVAKDTTLDRSAVEGIRRLLSGTAPDLRLLSSLRESAEAAIRAQLRA